MDNNEDNSRSPLDPRNIKLTGRTFDPNSPRYNFGHQTGRAINDISPNKQVNNPNPQIPQLDNPVKQSEATITNLPKINEDVDSLFPSPPQNSVTPPISHSKKQAKPKGKSAWVLPITIVLVDFIFIGLSILNKARYHHEYTVLLGLNFILALGLFARNSIVKKVYIGFQIVVVLISLALAVHFTLNYLNTNKLYKHNYLNIVNSTSAQLTTAQIYSLRDSQAAVIADRNAYIADSKAFYGLMALQIVQSAVFSVLLINSGKKSSV